MAALPNQTSIYLEKSLKVLLPAGNDQSHCAVATVGTNLQSLGFGLSEQLATRLATFSQEQVIEWYESSLPILQEMVGAHRKFEPFYPNFPQQVMDASDAELYFNAITHYFGFVLSDMLDDPNLVVLPNYEKQARPMLEEFRSLRWIDLGTEEDFDGIFTRLAASNGSLSESDREILKWFAINRNVDGLVPESIPQKETLALLVSVLPNPSCLHPMVKTATDVLRIAVALSEGDISLAEPTKFKSFSKSERREILGLLEGVGETRTEDMLRWKHRWIRLGERLHPGDFKRRFPLSIQAFDVLRDGKPFQTFNSKVEASVSNRDSAQTIRLLSQRPGEFARRLDHVLRTQDRCEEILAAFEKVADQVSTPVLFQLWNHFHTRTGVTSRAFFPKGNAAKVQFQAGRLAPIPEWISDQVADRVRQVLINRFASMPTLGKAWLDDQLSRQIVPFSQRSASRSLRSVARGSSFDLPQGNTVRFFCWWKNIDAEGWASRVDLDLSASFFKPNWDLAGEVAYYNLREGECYHSGDVTSAPKGACEFIDINLPSIQAKGIRYVVPSVLSYTRQPFVSLPECFCGWMVRSKPNSGEVFEARTVEDKVDLTAANQACVPAIIDVQERRVYWADLELKTMAQINNAANNSVGFSQIGRAIVELRKPSLHDLFLMHIEARGERTQNAKDADIVFGVQEGDVTAYDTDTILSEYLA